MAAGCFTPVAAESGVPASPFFARQQWLTAMALTPPGATRQARTSVNTVCQPLPAQGSMSIPAFMAFEWRKKAFNWLCEARLLFACRVAFTPGFFCAGTALTLCFGDRRTR